MSAKFAQIVKKKYTNKNLKRMLIWPMSISGVPVLIKHQNKRLITCNKTAEQLLEVKCYVLMENACFI